MEDVAMRIVGGRGEGEGERRKVERWMRRWGWDRRRAEEEGRILGWLRWGWVGWWAGRGGINELIKLEVKGEEGKKERGRSSE